MGSPIYDKLLGEIIMHDHSESDLGAILDSRYVNVTGDNLEGNLTADAGVLIDGYDVSVEFASIDTGIDGGAF